MQYFFFNPSLELGLLHPDFRGHRHRHRNHLPHRRLRRDHLHARLRRLRGRSDPGNRPGVEPRA